MPRVAHASALYMIEICSMGPKVLSAILGSPSWQIHLHNRNCTLIAMEISNYAYGKDTYNGWDTMLLLDRT